MGAKTSTASNDGIVTLSGAPLTPPFDKLSANAVQLCRDAFAGIDPAHVLDCHVHICGLGTTGSGCYVNDRMKATFRHPYHGVKLKVFLGAGGVTGREEDPDRQYTDNLATRLRGCRSPDSTAHTRAVILPFDQFYDESGKPDRAKSGFHVPNEYCEKLVAQYPDCFVMACSIHPYRRDAIEELDKWAAKGVRVVKWLPNSQGIDISNPLCIPFFHRMRHHDMILLCHTGEEHSVNAGFLDNTLGNPLFLRIPLDIGVKVICAHCATEGHCADIEKSGRARVEAFDMFLRLMDEPKYKKLLFADISSITAFLRAQYVERLLDRTDIHDRLLFATDYPVPAVWIVVWTRKIRKLGLINDAQKSALDELFHVDPILFDFVLKRVIRSKNGNKFADSIFQTHEIFTRPGWGRDDEKVDGGAINGSGPLSISLPPPTPGVTMAASSSVSSSSETKAPRGLLLDGESFDDVDTDDDDDDGKEKIVTAITPTRKRVSAKRKATDDSNSEIAAAAVSQEAIEDAERDRFLVAALKRVRGPPVQGMPEDRRAPSLIAPLAFDAAIMTRLSISRPLNAPPLSPANAGVPPTSPLRPWAGVPSSFSLPSVSSSSSSST